LLTGWIISLRRSSSRSARNSTIGFSRMGRRIPGATTSVKLDLAGRAPGESAGRGLPQPVDRAVGDAARGGEVARPELQHSTTGGRSAHDAVRHPHRVQNVQTQQRDMWRLHEVAAGVEHHLGRDVGLVFRTEPRKQFRRQLQSGQHPDSGGHGTETGETGLAAGIVGVARGHLQSGHGEHETRIDPIQAFRNAMSAPGAYRGPTRGIRVFATAQNSQDAFGEFPRIRGVNPGRREHRAHLGACAARYATLKHLGSTSFHREVERRDIHIDALLGWAPGNMPEVRAFSHRMFTEHESHAHQSWDNVQIRLDTIPSGRHKYTDQTVCNSSRLPRGQRQRSLARHPAPLGPRVSRQSGQ
jgi:hypothetical protein